MHKVILVTGGARSGKSYFAEQLCKNIGEKVSYLATSEAFDDEMKRRPFSLLGLSSSLWEIV